MIVKAFLKYNNYISDVNFETKTYTRDLFTEKQNITAKPFIKWAGGKTQLLSELEKYVPNNYNKYIEPFVGCRY